MQFIITEHILPVGYVNVCIFKGSFNYDDSYWDCLINHLCNPEEIKEFREAKWDWEQLSMWIEWIKSWDSRKEFEDEEYWSPMIRD